jgi:hypothetical protein
MNDARGDNGNQVTRKHDFVCTQSVNGDFTRVDLSGNKPTGKRESQTRPCSKDGASTRGLLPGHHVPEWDDSGSNDNSHEKVHPSEVETNFGQNNCKGAHDQTKSNNDYTRYKEDLGTGVGVNVLAVDIVGNQEDTAMDSADPVDTLAMKSMIRTRTDPGTPSKWVATAGGTRPAPASEEDIGSCRGGKSEQGGKGKWDGKPTDAS